MLTNIAVLRTVKENANKAVLDALPSILFDGSHNGKDAQKYYLQGPAAEYVPVDIPDETAKKAFQVRHSTGYAAYPSQQQDKRFLWT